MAGVVAAAGVDNTHYRALKRFVRITRAFDEGLAQKQRESLIAVVGQTLLQTGLLGFHLSLSSLCRLRQWRAGRCCGRLRNIKPKILILILLLEKTIWYCLLKKKIFFTICEWISATFKASSPPSSAARSPRPPGVWI